MSEQNTGGDGSVRWSVDADRVKKGDTQDSHGTGNPGKHHQEGIDQDGAIGDWFTVSIKLPDGVGTVDDYLNLIKAGAPPWGIRLDPTSADRVCFNLKIEKYNHD